MAARRTFLQLAVAAVNLTIAGLVFTSIWPFPSGDFQVHLPSANEIHWTYSNGIVSITAPFTINNGWIYNVDDLSISYVVTNSTGRELAADTFQVGSIPAGRIIDSQLVFTFDLLSLYNSGIDWMIYHDDMLYFRLDASCWYTMRLIHFDAMYQVSVPWDPLIEGFGISQVNYPATLPGPGEPISVSVDYWLSTSHLLSSLPPATVDISYFGNSTLLGHGQTTVTLGANYSGVAALDVTPALYTSYSVVILIQFGGYSFSQQYSISAPPWAVIP